MQNTGFVTINYDITSPKIPVSFSGVRIAVLADLHNCVVGHSVEQFADAVMRECPDVILLAGDMITEEKQGRHRVYRGNAHALIRRLVRIAPVLYAPGNHELRWSLEDRFGRPEYRWWVREIQNLGVEYLENRSAFLSRGGSSIRVTGLSLPKECFRLLHRRTADVRLIEQCVGKADASHFQILIAHEPFDFASYSEWGADLVTSGHCHGGVVRLPVIGGMIPTTIPLYPKYDRGRFWKNGTELIVSAGLGMHTIPFRFNNPPELVMLTLKPGKHED